MITEIGEISGTHNSYFKMWCSSVEPMKRELINHRHPDFEIALIEKGSGVYVTTDGEKRFSAGDVFVFSGNELHYITETGNDGLIIKNMHFNSRFLSASCGLINKYPYICFNRSDLFNCRITKSNAENITHYICNIENELSKREIEYVIKVRLLIEQIFIELIRQHNFLPERTKNIDNTLSKITDAMQYIDFHYKEQITLKEISDYIGTTPNYLSFAFKKQLNMKIWDYVTLKRIEEAKEKISSEKSQNILNIALDCGFNNTANFNRAFRTVTGKTPSEYRNNKEIIK